MSKKRLSDIVQVYPLTLVLMAVLLFASCKKEEKERPEKVLSESEMVDVMVDVHLAEAVLTRKRGENQEVARLSEAYYNRIYEKHDITKKTFDISFSYYQQNLSDLERIYEKVIVELNKMQREREMERKAKNDNEDKEEKKKPDSNSKTEDLKMRLKGDR